MRPTKPFPLAAWVEDNRERLRPPVCNKLIFEDAEFIVMAVGGPNSRQDYHVDPGEEFFYQLEGDMLLKTVQDGKIVDIPIREGEVFLLPPEVPHSPQRYENTVGLVIERPRLPAEQDGFVWFCEACGGRLYEEYFHLENIETQLPPVFDRFYSDPQNRLCERCEHVTPLPPERRE
jgi:3-hydroxyanthranilate 3,4-dioxygenase